MKLSLVLATAFATLGLSAPDGFKRSASGLEIIRSEDLHLEAHQQVCGTNPGMGCRTFDNGNACCCWDCTTVRTLLYLLPTCDHANKFYRSSVIQSVGGSESM